MYLKSKTAGILLTALSLLCSFVTSERRVYAEPKILVFSKTAGWHHTSIPAGIAAIKKLGARNGYAVDTTTDAANFNDNNLKRYRAVVFLNTTGNVLNGEEQAAFERYIQVGGGFVGVHSAADTEYDWPWYGKLAGAYFESHPNIPNVPNSNIRTAVINVVDKNHPATAGFPDHWERNDEWYNYRSLYPDIKVLAYLDEATYEGGTNGTNHPIAWYHDYDGGRAFYTGLGHTDESYSEPLFLQHLSGGIKYAMGDGKLDYSKAYAKVTPNQNRFVKTLLATKLNSPMTLAVADDGRVFFTQLFGELSVFNLKTHQLKLIHKFPVTTTGGTGVIGLGLDPNFTQNNFIYMYYAPGGQDDEPIYFRLSRFTLGNDNTIDLASEKVMLKVPVQKNSGSHHGGSIAWDKDGNLYLSTGDSSSPFSSNGYSPLDERPEKEHYSGDSQRSASNTNDLKGKILRIHPEADGSYTVPESNLFPKGMAKTKPEIYVMGVRNPYRISVNPLTSVLYWGEPGPDAGNDGPQGPRGYDEFNQAKKAGNFGWPYFEANNLPYSHWNFATNTAGPVFDPKAPVNNSPNNTGLNQLPPAMPAMIWYPYTASDIWPELGFGGRCAIGGPVYVFNPNGGSPNKFPDYYDGKLFIADWMRNWLMTVELDKNENFVRTESFMAANGDFRRPIDMVFSKDGTMYMLEYGSIYGVANEDASLVKIEYNTGNRPPIAKATIIDSAEMAKINKRAYLTIDTKNIQAIKTISGEVPLKVSFSGKNSMDLDDDDKLTYEWLFDGKRGGAKTMDAVYTYRKPGIYKAILEVTDRAGTTAKDTVIVKAGNTAPVVTIAGPGNKSFFWKDKPFVYSINVKDKEDKKIDPARVKAFYVYNSQPVDYTHADQVKILGGSNYPGKALMAASDCKSCHQIDKKAVGPSFTAIANRYKKRDGYVNKLAQKIISGGGGSWSKDFVMSAHPQLSVTDASEIVKYIYSLTDKKANNVISIPMHGKLILKYNDSEPRGEYTIVATYTDRGGKIVGPLQGKDIITLRHGTDINAAFTDGYLGFPRFRDKLSEGGNNAYLLMKDIDLTGIKQFIYNYGSKNADGDIVVHMDSQAGPVISTVAYRQTGSFDKANTITGNLINPITGRHDVYIYAVKRTKPNDAIIRINNITFME
ncbi:MAG: carbohydrate-binding protein [Mucilaginibacter sp.]|nr:carbohydrate-binding protein [Mucilaginibacter sp.]